MGPVRRLRRENYLFVGPEDAGDNIAGLYSLLATCEANGVNPLEYLTDVLIRVTNHLASDIDALLPDRWQPRTTP
jgi:transposase